MPHHRRINAPAARRGTATVELAVCLPALVLLVFGSMQACDMIYLKHSLMTAAYEGSLEAARPDASDSTVQGRVEQVLELRGVESGSCTITADEPIEVLPVGEEIRFVVRAPVAANLKFPAFFGTPNQLRVRFDCSR